ncbi:hypothetical protein FLL45_19835 [Aliikangiella marina]|uniref:Uncharacterized protein n=1 Tax=Aliikangiella marina TaxID=1712262 RepID=A0A545T2H7_9GAMM|nr:hypothetical protein [Aliikangiella marina]TQV71409.1 hypothetical protein FLL45_19835 [Aliikangiella marina]
MFFWIRRIFNSLQYHVDKNINETLYQNEAFQSSKWNLMEHNILRWSQRHTYYIFLALVLASLFIANLLIWKEKLSPVAMELFPHWTKLIDWQGGFLAGQLTIVGVVYPLVIGLIGVLFQAKSAKKTLFPIYQMYSGFMFAGLSGLLLSMFIIASYFLSASMDESTYLAICITTALWLFFNVLLTSWFFTVTFLMLDESKRDRLIVRYTIHELCEIDIRHRIRQLLLQNAVHQKLLVSPDENVLKVRTYKFSDDKYSEIKLRSTDKVCVNNVYFSIINIVIRYHVYRLKVLHWINRIKLGKRLTSLKGFGWLLFDTGAEPEVVVQPIWTTEKEKGLVVVRYIGIDIGWVSKAVIKASIKTDKDEEDSDKSLTSMMLGFVGTANDSIRDQNIGEFKYAIGNIVRWHIEIASALSFLNDNKEEDNWLLLPTATFFSRSYLDEILSEYYRLSKASVELISENIEFFDEMLYLHKRIFLRREKLVNKEGFSLIQGSYFIWSLLMEWRSYSSTSTDMRIASKYEDVLLDFVGAWEAWLDYIEPRSKRSKNIQQSLPLFLTHLEFTAHTTISALRHNNMEAAGWGVDMLNNWIEKLAIRTQGLEEYWWRSELVTHDILLEGPDTELWQIILNGNDFNLKPAFNLALTNAVFDLRIISACYILLKPASGDNDKIGEYVKALLAGKAIHPTGGVGRRRKSVNKASDILGAFIRHRDYSNYGEGSYGSWLSKVLDSFGRLNEKRRVSGRIYTGWGSNDVKSMNRAYVEIALYHSASLWKLEQKWFDIIFSNAFRHVDQESLVRDLTDWIKLSDEIENPVLLTQDEFNQNIDNFKYSIQKTIDAINQRQNEVVAQAEVDEELLTQFGVVCSEIFNSREQQLVNFPINLFKIVSLDGGMSDENSFKINIQDYLKQNIASNVDANRAINEEEWLKSATNNNVEINILRALLKYQASDVREYSDAESNVLELIGLAISIERPILFVGDDELSDVFYDARHNKELADKYKITFADGFGNNYICHLGEILVYSISFSDVNFSLLTTKELFESIQFSPITEEQFVQVMYDASEENENIGVLSLKYWMNINLKEDQVCIKTSIKVKEEQ